MRDATAVAEDLAARSSTLQEGVERNGETVLASLRQEGEAARELHAALAPVAHQITEHGDATCQAIDQAAGEVTAAVEQCGRAGQQGTEHIGDRIDESRATLVQAQQERETEHRQGVGLLTAQVQRCQESHAMINGIASATQQISAAISDARADFVDANARRQRLQRARHRLAELVGDCGAGRGSSQNWRQRLIETLPDICPEETQPLVEHAIEAGDWARLAQLLEQTFGIVVSIERAARAWRDGAPLQAARELTQDPSWSGRPEGSAPLSLLLPDAISPT